MNACLRRWHLYTFAALAIALPPLVASALAARVKREVSSTGDASRLVDAHEDSFAIDGFRDVSESFEPRLVRAWLHGNGADPARLRLEPIAALAHPDLLVYATAATGASRTKLPLNARLLGSLTPAARRTFELRSGESTIWLFSLGHQQVVACAELAAGVAR